MRMLKMLDDESISRVVAIYCSTEQKAMDGAATISEVLGIPYTTIRSLEKTTVPRPATCRNQSLMLLWMSSSADQRKACGGGSALSMHNEGSLLGPRLEGQAG
jgi:hypothetical protein